MGLPPSEALTPHEQADHYATRGAPDATADALADLADVYGRGLVAVRADRRGRRPRLADADAVREALAEGASGREKLRLALKV